MVILVSSSSLSLFFNVFLPIPSLRGCLRNNSSHKVCLACTDDASLMDTQKENDPKSRVGRSSMVPLDPGIAQTYGLPSCSASSNPNVYRAEELAIIGINPSPFARVRTI